MKNTDSRDTAQTYTVRTNTGESQPRTTEDAASTLRQFRVVQVTTWYVMAADKEDAEDRISDGMGDLSGTEYRAVKV